MQLRDEFVQTVLGLVRVRVGGSGPAMVFWPSLLMDGSMWAAQAEHFGTAHTVLLVDPPGHGASAPLTAPFDFEQCAQTIVQVLDRFGLDAVDYVGNSWGGMIGGTVAARYPDRIRSAVLMNCTASPAGLRQKVEFTVLTQLARLRGGIRPPLRKPAVDAFVGPTTRRERPEVVAKIEAALARVDVSAARWAVASVVPRRPDQLALLGAVRSPVLVVAGRQDATFPVAETRLMAEAIPGARFVVLERAAHLAALEAPAEVNALIEEFLSR
ncbi:alpha/beta fold hydrolase [Kutzneria viridogrisea]|uniref:3-oxoadipate enol-lactonase n=2 Tax=Kutzneria TaxID=43356 RepID=A0ABR6BJ74_9PSEU|nr:alpha/beta fold hydrolase [Kutzneria albida]AHH95697.1 putative hydrolase, alpha/beta fold [Kutzneria albida DSM 43870]MBA8926938.1 3-oxoadipate enol-lactonase [Kutzneria viridogrisea]